MDWDLSLVLKFLSSGRFRDWSTLSDKDLAQKLVLLLALATGKRRSELQALSTRIEWVNGEHSAVILHPDPAFVSKTHISSRALTAITITSLDSVVSQDDDDECLLCPVRTLSHYLERTKQYRSTNQKRLIISHQRGLEKDISMQTVSAYIKDHIISAHVEQDPGSVGSLSVKAHSVRNIATSLKAVKKLSMEDLLRAGAWTTPSVFISHYVKSFTTDKLSKLSRLGGFVAAGNIV